MAEKRALNLMIIEHNLDEAIEELTKLKKEATEGTIHVARLQIGLLHTITSILLGMLATLRLKHMLT